MRKKTVWLAIALVYLFIAVPEQSSGRQADIAATATPIDWSTVSTLDLETAVKIALMDNPGLQASAARVRQAKAQVDQARAAYWPRLDANAAGTRHPPLGHLGGKHNAAATGVKQKPLA